MVVGGMIFFINKNSLLRKSYSRPFCGSHLIERYEALNLIYRHHLRG